PSVLYALSLHDALPIFVLTRSCHPRGRSSPAPFFLVQAEPTCRRPACQVVPMEAAMMAAIPSHWDGGNCSPSSISPIRAPMAGRSEEHTSELQSRENLV